MTKLRDLADYQIDWMPQTLERLFEISSRGLKPHKAFMGVNAMAISGLWLASLYWSGNSLWSLWAKLLSGCACNDSALLIDKI
jgi:hypothetical protein